MSEKKMYFFTDSSLRASELDDLNSVILPEKIQSDPQRPLNYPIGGGFGGFPSGGGYPGGFSGGYPGGFPGGYPGGFPGGYPGGFSGGYPGGYPLPNCPFCEPTVFPYCYEKLLHDTCCCSPYGPYKLKVPGYGFTGIGYQCQYQDCQFLFAKSCEEAILISECCCNQL